MICLVKAWSDIAEYCILHGWIKETIVGNCRTVAVELWQIDTCSETPIYLYNKIVLSDGISLLINISKNCALFLYQSV